MSNGARQRSSFKSRIRWTRHRCCRQLTLVAGVEVGDEDPGVALQHLLDDRRLSGRGQPEEDVLPVGEDPDVLVGALDVDLGLVGVDERALEEPLPA